MKLLHFISGSTFIILFAAICTGCQNIPFAPVAIPNRSSIRIEKPVAKLTREDLLKLQKISAPEYKIAIGDVFNANIDGLSDTSSAVAHPVTIMPDGTASITPVGIVKLAGLTIPQANEKLTKEFRKYIRDCNVILEPQTLTNYTFTIGGAVANPGTYPLVYGVTRLVDAVGLAKGLVSTSEKGNGGSGFTGGRLLLSDLENAYVVRNGKILPIDFTAAIQKGDMLNNIPIANGDYIFIPSTEGGMISVLGEVGTQQRLSFQPGLTLLQVMAECGGLKDTKSWDIKVIRGGLKNPTVYNIDIKEMFYGRAMDFTMQPRDIVFVPKNAVWEWNTIIAQLMPTIQLISALAGPFGNPASFMYK